MLCISLLKENMIRASSSSQFVLMAIWLMAIWLMCVGFAYNVYAQDDIYIEKNEEAHVLRWNSEEGTTSFLQRSTDLIRWDYMLHYDVGDGSERTQEPDQEAGAEGQGLSFYRLQLYPTNLDDPDDTDGDGLHNLFELGHGYLPVLTDSDDDGVADGDEDLDEDGESNLTEIANGTDASDSSSNSGDEDFDEDGLSNKEESAIGTDPNRPDTDGDDIIDSQDGWPLCKELAPERLRRPKYAVISVKELESDETVTFFETNNNARALLTTYKSSNRSRPSYYYKTDAANPLIELPSSYTNSSGMISYHIYKSLNEANYFLRNPASGDNGNLYLEGDLIVTLASPESLPHDIGGFGNFDEPDGYPVTVNLTGQTYGTGSSQEYVDDTDDYTQYSYGQINYTAPILWSIAGQSSQLSPAIKHRFEPNGTGIGGGYALQGGRYDSGTFLAKIDKLNNNHIGLASQKVIDDYWYTVYPDDSGGSIITNFGAWFDSAFSLLLPNHNGVLSPVLHSTHLSNKNTVMAGQGSDTIIWLDQTAGLQNDQAVTGTPELKKVSWLDSWGPTPPINLNAKMQGFESNGSRIWHNSLWLDIADIVPESDWTDIKIKDINDHGMLAAQATNAAGKKCAVFLLPVEIVPDYNRDGMISDADVGQANEETPFVFWVNDDNDDNEIHEYADVPGAGTDGEDMRINGERDLVDFFPVQLRLADILEILPADQYSYVISHPTGALNFLEMPTVEPESQREFYGAGSYLANEDMAYEAMGRSDQGKMKSTAGEGSELSGEYLEAAKNGKGVLLIEAKKETEQSFELVICRKSDKSEMARIMSERWMNMVPVEDMFSYVNIRGAIEKGYIPPDIEEIQHERFRKTRKDRWFVFCHGYNVNGDSARSWNAEVFKRLHQTGSDAKFLGITWEGNQGQISEAIPLAGGKTPDYWKNVHNAFKSSSALSDVVNGLTGGEKVIAGHSLGNMLVSSAICDHDLGVAQYFMINAAVPREAYSASHAEADREKVRNEEWKNYPTRLWPSDYWNLGFAQGDGRRKLTWRGRFATLAAKTLPHNYYSSGEDVLQSGDGASPNLFNVVFKGEGAWIKQEMGKGKATKAFVSGIGRDGWTSTGGWKFNSDAYLSYLPNPLDPPGTSATNDPNTLTNAQLKTVPFFNPFRTFDGQSVHGENGSAIAGDYNNRSFLLGHDIPALSNPAGSNEVDEVAFGENTNTDMMSKLKSGNWGNWQHSDLKEQKMDHVWKLYEDMVSKGKLN